MFVIPPLSRNNTQDSLGQLKDTYMCALCYSFQFEHFLPVVGPLNHFGRMLHGNCDKKAAASLV